MKICIVTYPFHSNVGFLLQAWALQRVLRKEGYDVVTAGFFHKEHNSLICCLIKIKLLIQFIISFGKKKDYTKKIHDCNDMKIVNRNTNDFISKNIHLTSRFSSWKSFYKIKAEEYDAFIVGSDQVWRKEFVHHLGPFYLDFIPDENKKIKRISYAASFGVDKPEYTSKEIIHCKKSLKLFRAISVREKSGIHICKRYFDQDASLVLDPTLLLDQKDYISLIDERQENNHERYGATYILDKNPYTEKIIDSIRSELNIQTKEYLSTEKIENTEKREIEKCIYPKVEDFLKLYRDADFIITDSFHGTVFAIIFQKPYIVIPNFKRGFERFQSLIEITGMSDHFIANDDDIKTKIHLLTAPFPDADVQERLLKARKESFAFLLGALKQ